MSMSLYYSAKRTRPLTEEEQKAVNAVMQRYSVEDQIEQYHQTGDGPNWESFSLYPPPYDDKDTLLEGATKPPDNSRYGFWVGLSHLCAALSELRQLLPDAAWAVHLDDHDINWNEKDQAYDPSSILE